MDFETVKLITERVVTIVKDKKSTYTPPKLGVICGTGLGPIADALVDPISIPYEDIKGFPVSTVSGHEGKLLFGTLSGVSCVCLKGRFHLYEGYTAATVAIPIRVMKLLGYFIYLYIYMCIFFYCTFFLY
eukprot:GHVR01011683.1.p1 GENE.GHVR01011683.1~~GHVR01011683.1.p1  ORF type:complete len:130 (+),score=19.72 GHVR01011683.1:64-453(+)